MGIAKNLLLRFIQAPIEFFFWALVFIVPRDKKLILLGGMNGKYFGDNSAHLYEWLLANRPNLTPVWSTRSDKVFKFLNDQGKPVIKTWSFRAIFLLARANAACFTNSLTDFTPSAKIIRKDCKVFYLTHDIAPKRSRHARVGHAVSRGMLRRSESEKKIVSFYISSSPFITKCRSEALGVPVDQFRVTGFPRTDVLWQSRTKQFQKNTFMVNALEVDKVILYAPTWRSGRYPTDLLPFSEALICDLVEFLAAKKAVLVLRCHKNDLAFPEVRERLDLLISLSDRIIDGTHSRFGDVNDLLPEVDVLVSDYSGIVHDFLLLDRPIVLVPYDRASFEQANGFFYDYDEMAPGDVAVTGEQFLTALDLAFESPNHHQGKRQRLCDLVFDYQDDHACERVSNLIEYGDAINVS